MLNSDQDIRDKAAAYFDITPPAFDDLPFYRSQVKNPEAQVLELGCGTGRVLVPLAAHCATIQGIDISRAMLDRCRAKIDEAGIGDKAQVDEQDITRFSLKRRFDLVIAPNRVFQRMQTDEQVDRLFSCIGFHLRTGGVCILNAGNPESDRETLVRTWVNPAAVMLWERDVEEGRLKHFERRGSLDHDPLVLHPELIYRLNRKDSTYDQVTVRLSLRCWYPDEFLNLIKNHGYQVVDSWGGYQGEAYGEGPELVVAFSG